MKAFGGNQGLWVVAAIMFAACHSCGAMAAPINYEMVTVGNQRNANDPTTGNVYGGVNHVYQIGKYDVTIGQYTAFLNAVAKSDPYSLYNPNMATNGTIKGISQSGSSGSYTYSVIGSPNKPITYVSWFDVARFANWMQNGQGNGSTETGAYTLVGGQTSGAAVAKNGGATFWIPTENEWYKAAYYDPDLNAGAGGYWKYATQSNADPGNLIGSGTNMANYYTGSGYCVTQFWGYDMNQNYLTDVGVFTNNASHYGTFDQSGNVWQWNDGDGSAGSARVLRGGGWDSGAPDLWSSNRRPVDTSHENRYFGFRLAGPAAVPEIDPAGIGSVLALVTGGLALIERRRLKVA